MAETIPATTDVPARVANTVPVTVDIPEMVDVVTHGEVAWVTPTMPTAVTAKSPAVAVTGCGIGAGKYDMLGDPPIRAV